MRRLAVISSGSVLAVIAIVVMTAGGGSGLCDELAALQADADDGFPDYESGTIVLTGATWCERVTDPEQVRLGCTWERPIGETEAALEQYEALATDVRSCVADGSDELVDTSVNHPDSYESIVFSPPREPKVAVAVKQKSQLGTVLVTLAVVGPAV